MRRTALLVASLGLSLVPLARGQDAPDAAGDENRPVYSADDGWARGLLVGIGGLFAAAAVVGPVVWWRQRDLVPSAATHEEDPAADRH